MIALILTGFLLLGLPLLLLITFKSSAAIMFFASCAGIVLLWSLDPSVVATAGAIIPGEGGGYIRLFAVLLPLLFAAMMSRGTVHKASGLFLHGFLAVFTALMLWSMLPVLSGVSWLVDSTDQSLWKTVDSFKTVIVAIGYSLSLVILLRKKGRH